MRIPSIEQFRRLLYATHNMGGNAVPETAEGQACTEGAMAALDSLASLAASGPDRAAGVLIAAKLFVEVMSANDPVVYAQAEAMRALDGRRHEFEGAAIAVKAVTNPNPS